MLTRQLALLVALLLSGGMATGEFTAVRAADNDGSSDVAKGA